MHSTMALDLLQVEMAHHLGGIRDEGKEPLEEVNTFFEFKPATFHEYLARLI